MLPLFQLGELGSSFTLVALIFGVGLVLPYLVSPQNGVARALLFAVAWALSIRYAWWRGTETLAPVGMTWDWLASWSFFALELGAIISSLSAFLIMSRTRSRSGEADEHAGWWGPAVPRVAVLIATYNEDRSVLERTIVGAKALDHPAVDVYVLDDGKREWLQIFAASHGVHYVTRPDNKGAKAGNLNHTLELLAREASPPDFVAVLDADFVPHRNFLARTLPLFHDPEVGLVQTPQHFFNSDPIQHNLGLGRSYPDEQRFFFDHLQPSRDAWGIAFCCGTSSVARWKALREVGGFPTESITEDFMLTLALQDKGHRTVYLNEPVTEGLAPEGLKEYVTQRARWCLGLMQIARSRLGPLGHNRLRLRDRWSVADSVLFWTMSFSFRLAAITFPLLYWFFNITVIDASVPDIVSYFGAYFVWILMSLNFVSRGLIIPIVNDVSQLLGAIPITRAAFTGLVRPKGHPFTVTAKGGDRSRIVIQWRMMTPFVILFALSFLGLLIGIVSDRFAYSDAGDGKMVILFWTFYNLLVLAVTIIVCFELPRRERHFGDKPERATVILDGEPHPVWIASLTQDAARVRGMHLEDGSRIILSIDRVGNVPAIVSLPTSDGARLILEADIDQHAALMRRFYSEGAAPGVTETRVRGLVQDIARRLSFSSR